MHPSEEATALLARAKEGAARQDYKFAVDSLQRIIELPGDHILASDETTYESARLHAQRELSRMPAEVRKAYRIIYDGEATAIFNQAVEQHDEAAMRRLVDRSLLTSVGDDSAVTLADWLMDEGRFLEAAVYLRLVQTTYPDSDLPTWAAPLRLAVCVAKMNHRDAARRLLDEVASLAVAEESAVAARIDQVRKYVSQASASQPTTSPANWPMVNGRPSRDGYMPLVEPRFLTHLPWNVVLPVPQPESGTAAVEQYASRHGLVPAAEAVTDGRVLVVKSGFGLMGLDLATFDPVWTSRSDDEQENLVELEATVPAESPWISTREDSAGPSQLDYDPLVRRLYYDSVGNQVCLFDDLAFTVEWPREPPNTLAARHNRSVRRPNMPAAGGGQADPNFVVAYSLADGQRVWTSDTASGAAALGPVQFLAAPIAVDGVLLAPCRANDDLYAALLDPKTGGIVRHVYLCGAGAAPFDSLYACTPAMADGMMFIPTGRGVLLAIDVAGWSIRWAVRYGQAGKPVNEMTWLPSPVIAVSDVVILAPPDADSLLCFDRSTGKLRWSVPRNDANYLLAASDELAWTVGEQVRAVRIDSGAQAWATECGEIAGRAARSGDRLYVPTRSGMVAIDAASGRKLDQEGVAAVPPGNLLAYDGSLYVTSAFEIRKYPDMQRGYQQAVDAWTKQPTDAALAMRLAWLEQLRGEPRRALDVLSRVADSLQSEDSKRFDRLRHLKLLAMLDLAAVPDTPSAQARELLRQAQEIAPTSQDAIAATLALGDYLIRSDSPADRLEACLVYTNLATGPAGDQMMSDDSGAFEHRATLVADRRLTDAVQKLASDQLAALNDKLDGFLARAVAEHDTAGLRRMSNCDALARLGVRADMALAVFAARDFAYEQAEAYLQRALIRSQSPELTAEAVARLAALYLQPGELQLPVSASRLFERLEGEFAAIALPTDAVRSEVAGPDSGSKETSSGAQAAATLRQRIDRAVLAEHQAAMGPMTLGAPVKEPTTASYPNARPVVLRGPRPEALTDRWLLLTDERTLEARRVRDGELLWPAELRLLGEMAVESRTISEGMRSGVNTNPPQPARAIANGQTLILNTRYGLHAVGLLTGRRLWSRRFDPPMRAEQAGSGSDACVWTADGYVVSVDYFGRLEVARVEAGADVLWRRRMLERRWQTVRTFGGYVLAVDAQLEQVDIFKLSDGTYIGQCQFDQLPDPTKAVNIAVAGGVVWGPKSDHEVLGLELATPGLERWKIQTKDLLTQIFKPAPDLIGVAEHGGRIQVVEPVSGKVTLDVVVPGCSEGAIDGRIDNGVLYVYGFRRRAQQNRSIADTQEWALAAVRVNDGKVLWHRTDLGSMLPLTGDVLEASPNVIPVLVYRPFEPAVRTTDGAMQNPLAVAIPAVKGGLEFALIDKATGVNLGDKRTMETDVTVGRPNLLDMQVWPDGVTVFFGSTRVSFP